jgi:hypothetical protein
MLAFVRNCFLACALVSAGCATVLDIQEGRPEGPSCASDDDCAPGNSCRDCGQGLRCITAAVAASCGQGGQGGQASCSDDCDVNATCVATPTPHCECKMGFGGEGTDCQSARLIGLEVDPGHLMPDFAPDTLEYQLVADEDMFNFTPTAEDGEDATIVVDGDQVDSGSMSEDITIMAAQGITIEVTAEDDAATVTYTIHRPPSD